MKRGLRVLTTGLCLFALGTTTASAATPGSWSPTGSLTTARAGIATLLGNGKVLFAGGGPGSSSSAGALASAELYDPATGTWSATGSMNAPRAGQTSTLLPNGKVLVAGGANNSNGVLASAELFDPTTGLWTPTGSMTIPRQGHTATLLASGQVLVAAGGTAGGVANSAELYNPTTGTWTATGSMAQTRDNHTATLLPNGKVLVAGGWASSTCNPSSAVASAELYDPATGLWTATASMAAARTQHDAVLLNSGKVLVVGGGGGANSCGSGLASAELYDPAAGTWSQTGSLNAGRQRFTAALLPSGRVLAAGGFNCVCLTISSALASAELYDPAVGAWSTTGSMSNARFAQAGTALASGKVLVAGGFSDSSAATALSSAELFTPVPTTPAELSTVVGQLQAAGCIDNSGIANALIAKLSAAQSTITAGDIKTATNILTAFIQQVSAQSGKHILTSCTVAGVTINPAAVLIADAQSLIDGLTVSATSNPITGSVATSAGSAVAGATLSLVNSSGTTLATATTDITGFYYFATTGLLTSGATYSVSVTGLPTGFATASPVVQTLTWSGGAVTLSNFTLS